MSVSVFQPQLALLALVGLVGGLVLFARGLLGWHRARAVASLGTSSISTMAAGEVRLTGTVVPLTTMLTSPLRSRECVWYRARVSEIGDGGRELLDEERAAEFLLRDESGEVRILPRGARWEVPPDLDASDDMFGGEPPELRTRAGPATSPVVELDREAAIQALLTVRPAGPGIDSPTADQGGTPGLVGLRRRRYVEARLEPGTVVTVIGQALPWVDAVSPMAALDPVDPIDALIAADLEAARAAGQLRATPEEAWGNAAIAGFGIGQPARAPVLDAEADAPEAPDPEMSERAERLFDVPDETLVIAAAGGSLTVHAGLPGAAVVRYETTFVLGLMGAVAAVASAVLLGVALQGGI